MREEDLERLYVRLEKPLCNVVFRWVWNMDEAQDLVQDAFVRLWRMRTRVDLRSGESNSDRDVASAGFAAPGFVRGSIAIHAREVGPDLK